MKKILMGLVVFSMATIVALPSDAQDFDKLMFQKSSHTMPIGFQLRVPFGSRSSDQLPMQLNVGYSLTDASGKSAFMPLAGYDATRGGLHLMGVSNNAESGKSEKMFGYVLAAALGTGALLMMQSKSESTDCPPGYLYEQATGLCQR